MKNKEIILETITELKDIKEDNYYTVARATDESNCVELHCDNGELSLEIGEKDEDGTWNDDIIFVDWDFEDLTDENILDKLYEIFIETF